MFDLTFEKRTFDINTRYPLRASHAPSLGQDLRATFRPPARPEPSRRTPVCAWAGRGSIRVHRTAEARPLRRPAGWGPRSPVPPRPTGGVRSPPTSPGGARYASSGELLVPAFFFNLASRGRSLSGVGEVKAGNEPDLPCYVTLSCRQYYSGQISKLFAKLR